MQRVLICEDEPDLAALVELNLKAEGFAVEVAHTGEAALQVARAHRPDLVLLDLGYRLAPISLASPGGSHP